VPRSVRLRGEGPGPPVQRHGRRGGRADPDQIDTSILAPFPLVYVGPDSRRAEIGTWTPIEGFRSKNGIVGAY